MLLLDWAVIRLGLLALFLKAIAANPEQLGKIFRALVVYFQHWRRWLGWVIRDVFSSESCAKIKQ